ncbi:hypothetical protein Scep_016548 [Stephania cephalantha]|uniref:Uncharacterized protein n=1 Tax=Stephania cephalantha TaxID=152367 RepID=A0AAP0INP5_9MAGN
MEQALMDKLGISFVPAPPRYVPADNSETNKDLDDRVDFLRWALVANVAAWSNKFGLKPRGTFATGSGNGIRDPITKLDTPSLKKLATTRLALLIPSLTLDSDGKHRISDGFPLIPYFILVLNKTYQNANYPVPRLSRYSRRVPALVSTPTTVQTDAVSDYVEVKGLRHGMLELLAEEAGMKQRNALSRLMMVTSDGRFRNVKHQVMTNGLRPRLSMIYFTAPSLQEKNMSNEGIDKRMTGEHVQRVHVE